MRVCPFSFSLIPLTPEIYSMLKLEDIYDVTVAKDGQEAYDTVKANMEQGKKFDLIFMDIQVSLSPVLLCSGEYMS